MNSKIACRKRKHYENLTKAAIRTFKMWGDDCCTRPWWNKSHANRYALLLRLEKDFGKKSYQQHLQKKAE